MKSPDPPERDTSQNPDCPHCPQRIAPLKAQARHRTRCQEQHCTHPKIGGIPEVSTLPPQYIFGCNRQDTAQHIGPEQGRPDQDSHADPGDIGTGQPRPPAPGQARQHPFGQDTAQNGRQGLSETFQNTERNLSPNQDAANQCRWQVPAVQTCSDLFPQARIRPPCRMFLCQYSIS